MTRTDMAYRQMAAASASGLGLLIALLDAVASDLRRAALAQRLKNIEGRCREMTHAFTIIGVLESSLRESPGGDLTDQLALFYAAVRNRLMEAQVKQSPELLEREMAKVLDFRESLQRVELGRMQEDPEMIPPASSPVHAIAQPAPARNAYGGWSA